MKYIILLCMSVNIFAAERFQDFMETIKQQAQTRGVSTQTLSILDTITPNPRILELDNSQAEFSLNFWQYVNSRVSPNRILLGKIEMHQHSQLFQEVYHKYGVPKHILIAFYGLESNFGANTGSFNLVRSLATLAFDKRRRTFFTEQLLATLTLIDDKKLQKDVKSSWAGAMGSVQFMPSNVAQYGIDNDNDGSIDLWNNPQDIFHSAAYFLSRIGWNKGEKWGREVLLPKDFDYSLADLTIKKNLNEWSKLGITTTDAKILPQSTLQASLLLPMGYTGPAFLVYRNFRAILNWNRSTLYALSVGILANKFLGIDVVAPPIFEEKLSKDDIKLVQQALKNSGLEVGVIDGIVGSKTRAAVRTYQKQQGLPADGYIGKALIEYIQQ
jgi:membrane-bound lytic murein transglycosylase B